ncbi:hypothetical protein NLM31_38760 [Bradyrhizobium sp. CCGUVB4N]|uniref:hypothetical protein n=1 Tax=Bradyrhizobium sp. CCGUVB4N TaxID=2949631 RepID=UPI0020B31DC9|nr:hypothetical protein [Bradyrhizobium sp. CCGUVB4N]MCP3386340.1 hypothetical protein [Bradyrhizobium sp. CCGUVB4N]
MNIAQRSRMGRAWLRSYLLRGLVTAALGLLTAPLAAFADTSDIEHRCTALYPSMTQYFAWKDCVKAQTAYEENEAMIRRAEERKRSNEEAARPCIAADIPRMESLAAKVKASVLADARLEETQAAIGLVLESQGVIEIPDNDIRERVLITSIHTQCASDFHFLINVREGKDKKIRWLRVSAENAPAGYPAKIHDEFGNEFEENRERERMRAQDAAFQESLRAHMADEERKAKEVRREFLKSVKISNLRLTCDKPDLCTMRTIEFKVTNVSQSPVKDVSFGWMFASKATDCPAELGTNERRIGAILQPGQSRTESIVIFGTPAAGDAKLCLKVTDLRGLERWEH